MQVDYAIGSTTSVHMNRLIESPMSSLLSQFMRCTGDAVVLYIRTPPIAGSPFENTLKLLCHRLDSLSEVGQLTRDERHIPVLNHPISGGFLGGQGFTWVRLVIACPEVPGDRAGRLEA
jgi:hypothetical protein